MNIQCFLVTEGKFKAAVIPQKLLMDLIKSLRTKGNETVHFADESINVEGVYIPAKSSKTRLVAFQDEELKPSDRSDT